MILQNSMAVRPMFVASKGYRRKFYHSLPWLKISYSYFGDKFLILSSFSYKVDGYDSITFITIKNHYKEQMEIYKNRQQYMT